MVSRNGINTPINLNKPYVNANTYNITITAAHACMPEWSSNKNIITNEDEIEEAYIAYKKLGIIILNAKDVNI